MTYSYRFLPDVALADVAFQVRADSWEELFRGAAEALTGVMVDRSGLESTISLPLLIAEETVGEALHSFLSEIVYLKDAQSFLVHHPELAVSIGPPVCVEGTLLGDMLDRSRHELGQDVKAITYHMFQVTQTGQEYLAQVVLDI